MGPFAPVTRTFMSPTEGKNCDDKHDNCPVAR